MRRLHVAHQGAHLAISLLEEPETQDFISTHASILDSSFEKTVISDTVRQSFQKSNYIFSGIKTFHELNEAFPSLVDENGNRKPFEQFLNDVRSVDETYNESYLRAEYNFCQQSANMASKWEQFMEDGDRYNLQYRTAGDDHVRPAHAALDRITLPPSHPFWQRYFPPNGWNCRCTVVQVRKSKYPVTPDSEVEHLIEQNDSQNPKEDMFRFNPGIEQKTFPDYNAYTIRRCQDCPVAKGYADDGTTTLAAFIPDNEQCAACKLIRQCSEGKTIKSERERIEQNRKLYDRLSKDSRYVNVEFNPVNGALKATHRGHNEEKNEGTRLERKLMDALYSCGHSVILCDEQKKGKDGNRLTALDMILDGVRMDIKSITKNKNYYGSAIRGKNDQLYKFNRRSDIHEKADTICLYFDDPTMFAPEKITKGYEFMKYLTKKEICIKHIICAINSAKGLELRHFDFK